jgi:hypothetical protein
MGTRSLVVRISFVAWGQACTFRMCVCVPRSVLAYRAWQPPQKILQCWETLLPPIQRTSRAERHSVLETSRPVALPFLQSFTSSMSCGGVAPRSIVWAANGPMLYAQLALRSRRAQEASSAAKPTATSASATEDAAIPCQTLTEQYRLIRADCLQPCDL